MTLSNGASLKDSFCQSLKIFEKCGKKARILEKISVSVQSAKIVNIRKLINEIFVAGYIINISQHRKIIHGYF